MAGLGGAAVPACRFGVVRWQPPVPDIEIADQRRRLRVAGQGRAAQPRLALDEVLLGLAPFHQRQTPALLRRALPALRRMAVELHGDIDVPRHPDTLLGQHRQQVDRTRQFRLCGMTQVHGDLPPALFVIGPRRQRQGIAEAALRAARRRRALVPGMRRIEVAHRFRAAGQNVGEHRLTLRGAGLRRLPGPFQGGLEIRVGRLVGAKQTVARGPVGEAVHAQPSKQRLSLDMPMGRRALKPAHAFRPAGRHAGAFEIAARDAVFRLGDPGPCRARQQREGRRHLAALAQPDRPA